ncbi:haloacid dehalogenase-like hydrolase [Streptomyces sp. GMY02]|uniref:HAD family hydrolase n=1 Tax=Streptomyces sp. GMY02 TaxID=1333528 RepID=UPI001C2CAE85|nr:haloacid dehalogenase-like hydrolase [Streptomyces sp. GMY02]QXE35512.1 haloacid dehalogenase-like hydrolase [Streptomyces sp. GMY02]
MTEAEPVLVLWDIDRTLLYVGDIDRQVYRECFAEIVGRPAERLPARGTGMTMPLAIRGLLLDNGVPEQNVPGLLEKMVQLLPKKLADHSEEMRREGILMPGAVAALSAVADAPPLVATIVTGNLKANARLKLDAFDLVRFVDTEIGGYASDSGHRPSLVAVAQNRAKSRYGSPFTRANTVIIGDSLEDVRTGREGGASVIAVASGTTPVEDLGAAGADMVLDSLEDVERLMAAISTVTTRH